VNDEVGAVRRRRAVRVLAAGTTSCVLAMGFLASSVASVPWNTFPSHSFEPAAPEPISLGRIGGTTTLAGGPTTVAQLLGLIEQAERAAIEAGQVRSQQIEQAAAELGMLLATYTAQQRALEEPRVGIVPLAARDDATPAATPAAPDGALPVVDASPVDHDVLDGGAADVLGGGAADVLATDLTPPAPLPAEPTPTESTPTEPAGEEPPAAVPTDPALVEPTPVEPALAEPQPEDAAAAAVDPHDSHAHGDETVTFDDVVVAAMRLANLLDPATASFVTDILPAGGLSPAMSSAVRAELTESLLAVVEQYAGTTAGYENGQIPASVLCPLEFAPGHRLRCDAAEQLTKLSAAYEAKFGVPIPITDSYRSYDAQVAVRAAKPHLAAVPGTSNHGWGLAVDLSHPISGGTSPEYVWLRVHGPDYGWDNPAWARPDGSKPEPWHFEFFAAGPIPDRAWSSGDVRTGGGSGVPRGERGTTDERPAGTPGPGAGQPADAGTPTPSTPPSAPSPAAPVTPKPSPSPSAPAPTPTAPTPTPTRPSPTPTEPTPTPSPSDPTPSPTPSEPTPTPTKPAPEPTDPAPSPSEPEPAPSEPTTDGTSGGATSGGTTSDDSTSDDSTSDDSTSDDSTSDDTPTTTGGTTPAEAPADGTADGA
jgi:hypothetical protein